MQIKKYGAITLIVLCLALVGAAWVGAAQSTTIRRHVIAGGGARLEQGNYTLRNTVGQPVAGVSGSGTTELCAGFWCRSGESAVYLPLALKGVTSHR